MDLYGNDSDLVTENADALDQAQGQYDVANLSLQQVTRQMAAQRARAAQVQDIYNQAAQQLSASRAGPSNSEKWFAIAAALGQPTKTGSFGEVAGNLAQQLGGYAQAERQAKMERAKALQEMQLKQRLAGIAAEGKLGELAMKYQAGANKPMVVPAGATVLQGGKVVGTGGPRMVYNQFLDKWVQAPTSAPAAGQATAGAPSLIAPPREAIRALQLNPTLQAQFDAKYGSGSAARYLGQGE